MANAHFIETTTEYWQVILPGREAASASWQFSDPARLPDSRILKLPIRALTANEAVASLIINQAAIDVTAQLGAFLAAVVKPFAPDVIVGLPTPGLTLAPIIAQSLGHRRYVPLGYSRKVTIIDDAVSSVKTLKVSWDFSRALDPRSLAVEL
ncbi:related to Phosphoribosyltransferase, putative [Rhynchosporium agropyri]|uniref:Related to Phosphoribosyltransferase, putative n=1 Tax=Rhynchosporium agropyri TaxID=914238 RepID=A0A1E1KPD9_9HELO|nr:related to Phosphoribosyltransferase, putative [Rhynchosporium agropyri]